MVENSIVAEKEKESNLFKKEARKTLTDFTEKLGVYLKLFEDPNVKDGKYKAMKKIDELENGDKELGLNQYAPLYKLARQYLNGEIEDKIKYNDKVNSFIKKETKKIDLVANAIIEAGIKNIAKEETLKEIQEKYKNIPPKELKQMIDELLENEDEDVVEEEESERNNATMEEKEETENSAEINEVEQDEFDPEKDLSRPKPDEVKKIYKYKVEGKITSKIDELDQFLGIIQPVLNQLIIIPWKFVYEGMDMKKMMFERFGVYQKRHKDVDNMHEALKSMQFDDGNGNMVKAVPNGMNLKNGVNLKKSQNQAAKLFNDYMCEALNKKLDEQREEYIQSIMSEQNITRAEAENQIDESKYKHRTKFFDFSKEYKTPRKVLTTEFAKLVRNCRDNKGKIDDAGKKKLSGFIAMIDLFNMDDKDIIPNNYANIIHNMSGDKWENLESPTFGEGHIEDDVDALFDEDEEKKKNTEFAKQLRDFLNTQNQNTP